MKMKIEGEKKNKLKARHSKTRSDCICSCVKCFLDMTEGQASVKHKTIKTFAIDMFGRSEHFQAPQYQIILDECT